MASYFWLIFCLIPFINANTIKLKAKYIPEEGVVTDDSVTDVHIIFMNHLDVGYSIVGHLPGLVGNVLNTYFHNHFPAAIRLANQLTANGYTETFSYTSHPFLVDLYLNCPPNMVFAKIHVKCPNSTEVAIMKNAINKGIIQWHAGPMNMQYELLSRVGLNLSLGISDRLDSMFAMRKNIRVLSQRDVPGITKGVLRDLVANRVLGITHGINSGSAVSNVPNLFRWRHVNSEGLSSEVVYMQNKGGYPDNPGPNPAHPGGLSAKECHRAPSTGHLLCFSFRNDNSGPPQSVAELLMTYEILRARYPSAHIYASSLEKFFSILWTVRNQLPLVTEEMGDTWVQGAASDPLKMVHYRSISKAFDDYFENKGSFKVDDTRIANASRFFVKLVEHTWGLSGDGDSYHWTNAEFKKIRNNPNIRGVESSWIEQRHFIDLVLESLEDHPIKAKIEANIKAASLPDTWINGPDLKGYVRQSIRQFDKVSSFTNITFGSDGSIVYMSTQEYGIMATEKNPLGQLLYRTYNQTDTGFFLHYYSNGWNTGYGKPNCTANAHPESKWWAHNMTELYWNKDDTFLAHIKVVDKRANTYYGAPLDYWIEYQFMVRTQFDSTPAVDMRVIWFNKPPTRLMETLFIHFKPVQASEPQYSWKYSKVGAQISPYDVMKNGSQWQHGIDTNGVFIRSPDPTDVSLQVISVDTYMACPVTSKYGPTTWPAPLFPIIDQITGVAFPFYTNIWMTNYVFWYPYNSPTAVKDAKFAARFQLRWFKSKPTRKVASKKRVVPEKDDILRFYPY